MTPPPNTRPSQPRRHQHRIQNSTKSLVDCTNIRQPPQRQTTHDGNHTTWIESMIARHANHTLPSAYTHNTNTQPFEPLHHLRHDLLDHRHPPMQTPLKQQVPETTPPRSPQQATIKEKQQKLSDGAISPTPTDADQLRASNRPNEPQGVRVRKTGGEWSYFNSIRAAAVALNLNRSSLAECILGLRAPPTGYELEASAVASGRAPRRCRRCNALGHDRRACLAKLPAATDPPRASDFVAVSPSEPALTNSPSSEASARDDERALPLHSLPKSAKKIWKKRAVRFPVTSIMEERVQGGHRPESRVMALAQLASMRVVFVCGPPRGGAAADCQEHLAETSLCELLAHSDLVRRTLAHCAAAQDGRAVDLMRIEAPKVPVDAARRVLARLEATAELWAAIESADGEAIEAAGAWVDAEAFAFIEMLQLKPLRTPLLRIANERPTLELILAIDGALSADAEWAGPGVLSKLAAVAFPSAADEPSDGDKKAGIKAQNFLTKLSAPLLARLLAFVASDPEWLKGLSVRIRA